MSQSSWWPKQSTWKAGGLNNGYWSPACEEWFQKRLEELRRNPDVRIAATWRVNVRYCMRAHRLADANNLQAANFIAKGGLT
jgi:hypothetical protein